MTNKFTDIHVERDSDGVYDCVIEDGDLKLTGGMDSAIFISLFTDRRANPDEVANPMDRRGWCGTQNTRDAQGNKGSGIWLYEQRRLDADTTEGVRMEAYQALHWKITDRLAKEIDVTIEKSPHDRRLGLKAAITAANGGVTNIGYQLWEATPQRTIKK